MFTELFSLVRRRLLDKKSNIPTCPSLIKTNVSHRYSDLYAGGSNACLQICFPWFRILSEMASCLCLLPLPLPPASASCLCLLPLPRRFQKTFSDALLLQLQISASRRTTPTRGGKNYRDNPVYSLSEFTGITGI